MQSEDRSGRCIDGTGNAAAAQNSPFIENKDKRKSLIELLRGSFACPVISSLGEIGIADAMLAGPFCSGDFASVAKGPKLEAVFQYLHAIGLIQPVDETRYILTSSGRRAVSRNGAFSLLASYSEYFDKLPEIIAGKGQVCSVNRVRNVRGSGQLHSRKFFPAAFASLESPPSAIIDVGCGDGCFLEHARGIWPDIELFGVDVSEAAVHATRRRLESEHSAPFMAIKANGFEVSLWSSSFPDQLRKNQSLVISLWFVAHEFSQGEPGRIVEFFLSLQHLFPLARVILGEICKIPPEILANNHEYSIMPEFLLFHELSGQGVLTWHNWNELLMAIPYSLRKERKFDEVCTSKGHNLPASFLWMLEPRA